MNQAETIAILREQKILDQLADGPVAMMLQKNGKLVPATVTRKGEWVMVTTGRFFRRRMRISQAQLRK